MSDDLNRIRHEFHIEYARYMISVSDRVVEFVKAVRAFRLPPTYSTEAGPGPIQYHNDVAKGTVLMRVNGLQYNPADPAPQHLKKAFMSNIATIEFIDLSEPSVDELAKYVVHDMWEGLHEFHFQQWLRKADE